MDYIIEGGKKLGGTVTVNTSKNASVAMMAASLLNKGSTTLKRVPRIEEVKRLIEVMQSIGVTLVWDESGDLHITPPEHFSMETMDIAAAQKTRSIALFIAPLVHRLGKFRLPAAGGCQLGQRSLGPHFDALQELGISITPSADACFYEVEAKGLRPAEIIMYEASDTGVENILMAASLIEGKTQIKFASGNYMVQDTCIFLQAMGVRIDGIGTPMLTVHGVKDINEDVIGFPSEDPIEAMFFVSLAATTRSELEIKRVPIDFLELELFTLKRMGLKYDMGQRYFSDNNHTLLTDVKIYPSTLHEPIEKIAPRPYPGINIDNLPFFVPIAAVAEGKTLIHDWVYENRAQYYVEMAKLGANIEQLDPHRVEIKGPVTFHNAELTAPPALRPATLLLIGMLAAEGRSVLKNVYPIMRGYENLHGRLKAIGAEIEMRE